MQDPVVNILHRSNPLLLRREGVNSSETFSEFCLNLTSSPASIHDGRNHPRHRKPLCVLPAADPTNHAGLTSPYPGAGNRPRVFSASRIYLLIETRYTLWRIVNPH